MEATNLADLYHSPLLDWSRIEARLRSGLSQAPGTGGPDRHTCWLASINPDGSPHVTGIGALWANGCFWFETGKDTRKGRNLARDPRCTLSVAAQPRAGQPGSTTPGWRSPLSTVRPRLGHLHGTCTASHRARRRPWASSILEARRGGASRRGRRRGISRWRYIRRRTPPHPRERPRSAAPGGSTAGRTLRSSAHTERGAFSPASSAPP